MHLDKLKREQLNLAEGLNLKDAFRLDNVRYVAGIDLTYKDVWKNPTLGISCIVVVDIENRLVVDTVFAESVVDFPYVPTFLAYRELPLVLAVYRKLKRSVDVFMLDGMGIIHPRRMGIASHFGVVTNEVSLGCAKSHLIGSYDMPANVKGAFEKVFVEGELRGFVLRSKANSKPIFISPGNNISFESALEVTLRCLDGYRIPMPTRLAHNYLQEYRRKLKGIGKL